MVARPGLPGPFVLEGSSWGGDDGNWSTFRMSLGTPAQEFELLPFTSTSQIMVLARSACDGSDDAAACPSSRGAGVTLANNNSAGFASSTWNDIGEYPFSSVAGYSAPVEGNYGLDNATLRNSTTGASVTLQNQTMALYNTSQIWIGSLGLGTSSSPLPGDRSVPGLLSAMKSENLIPSLSFGYQAGSSSQSLPGSLALGGYDASAYTPQNTSWYIAGKGAPLQIWIDRLVLYSNTTSGLTSVSSSLTLSNRTYAIIDSSTPYIWLPEPACAGIAEELKLGYNVSSGLYVANADALDEVRTRNFTLTFTLDSNAPANQYNADDAVTVNIPFSMLDLELSAPLGEDGTSYFPMKQIPHDASSNAIVLGRSFLQAVYLIVDWERQNFTLSQARRASGTPTDIRIISPVLASNTTGSVNSTMTPSVSSAATSTSSSMPTSISSSKDNHAWEIGTIVGVVVGVCVMIALAFWIRLLVVRKKRLSLAAGVREIEQRTPPPPAKGTKKRAAAVDGSTSTTRLTGMQSTSAMSQIGPSTAHEVPSSPAELEAKEVRIDRNSTAPPRIDYAQPDFGVPLDMEMSWLSDTDEFR